jgi:hypothetical protein
MFQEVLDDVINDYYVGKAEVGSTKSRDVILILYFSRLKNVNSSVQLDFTHKKVIFNFRILNTFNFSFNFFG